MKLKGDRWDEAACPACLPPLFPENQAPSFIFSLVSDQVIFAPLGMNGCKVAALNHEAVHRAMELYEVGDKQTCFEGVLTLFRELILEPQETA